MCIHQGIFLISPQAHAVSPSRPAAFKREIGKFTRTQIPDLRSISIWGQIAVRVVNVSLLLRGGVGKLRERHRRIRRKRERVREVETDRHREQRIGKESEREKMLKGAMFHV